LPFDYFWKFENKSIISATPYYFSDPRFYQLAYHEIKFTETLGKVHLVNAVSVTASLNYLLTHADSLPGNIHIFYNSVTEIRNAVVRAELKSCNIYCADDKNKENIRKLKEAGIDRFFVPEPKTGEYKKINFYTCRYFEGWDLFDENATVVLVTDIHKPHTKVGVASKGKQAIGRLRNKPYQIIHITNHAYNEKRTSLDEFRADYYNDAVMLISHYNNMVNNSKTGKFNDNPQLKFFADICTATQSAVLNYNKLDQQ